MRRTTSADGGLSWGRVLAVLLKELVQLKRDRLTFAMLIGVPLMQLVLFGYAINGDPRALPTAVVAHEQGPLVRAIVRAVHQTIRANGFLQCYIRPLVYMTGPLGLNLDSWQPAVSIATWFWNRGGARTYQALRPCRHAWWTSAQAR